MANKKYLGTITILIKDRQMHAGDVQQMLTDNGHMVMARMGVNVQPACIEHCTGLITVALKGSIKEIKELGKNIDALYGIVAKTVIVSD